MGRIFSGGTPPSQPVNQDPSLGFDFVNYPSDYLKDGMRNGQRGITCEKACCYFGYRIITYTFIPTILNALATIASIVLGILTLPTRFCGSGLNDRCWNQVVISGTRLGENIALDLTYDLVQVVFFLCCCTSDAQTISQAIDYDE